MSTGFLELIKEFDNVPVDFNETNCFPYYRLFISPDTRPHGYVHPSTIANLTWPIDDFTIDETLRTLTLQVQPTSSPEREQAINAAFQRVIDDAIASSSFPSMTTHSEPFLLTGLSRSTDACPAQIERFTSSLFGIATRGAHMTAYAPPTLDPPLPLRIWVARRSAHLVAHPSLLDSSVAGGVKASSTPLDCILAESYEEALLSPDFVAPNVKAVGAVTLANRHSKSERFHAEVLYVFDLEMPIDIIPTPGDEEVEEFVLMEAGEVMERMLAREFKPNVCPVMIDFLMRHGIITPDNEPDYVEICTRLHRQLPMPTRPS
ncbi:NUDIX hydrolase domain protein [Sarocladium implicatum]|nr:NUDIX hydrolase domain protein [Sarocladium implicatum]